MENQEKTEQTLSSTSDESGAQERPKKRPKKKQYVIFDEETEKELAEWYQAHPIFYNKKQKEYKDADRKNRMLNEKAAQLNPPTTGKSTFQTFTQSA